MAKLPLTLAVGVLLLADAPSCLAQWTQTIDCPTDRVYRDQREYAGREEFCEHLLPGSLRVRDGPYRSWFSEGHPGEEGNYGEGRKVGSWRECNRFDRCKQMTYEPSDESERQRKGFRPEIPLTYAHGKYAFDFASCRRTWVTQATDKSILELNIGGAAYRCDITYIPQYSDENSGKGQYLCRVPFAVGTRELRTLDLRHELLDLGLPQFCKSISTSGEALLILKNGSDLATTVDVVCVATQLDRAGHEVLNIRLNQYASDLLSEVADQQGSLETLVCLGGVEEAGRSVDGNGEMQLIYRLSNNPTKAKKQKQCVAKAIELKSTCR